MDEKDEIQQENNIQNEEKEMKNGSSYNKWGVLLHCVFVVFFVHALYDYQVCKPFAAWVYSIGLLLLPGINLIVAFLGIVKFFNVFWLFALPLAFSPLMLLNKKGNKYNLKVASGIIIMCAVVFAFTSPDLTADEVEERCMAQYEKFFNKRYAHLEGAEMGGAVYFELMEEKEVLKRKKKAIKIMKKNRALAKRLGHKDVYGQLGLLIKLYTGSEDATKAEVESFNSTDREWKITDVLEQ